MNKKTKLEILWWIFTIILVVLVILPIYSKIGDGYNYYQSNILFIIFFLTFSRFIFLLRHIFFADMLWVKALFILASIPLFLYGIDAMYNFQRDFDETGLLYAVKHLSAQEQENITKYIKYEYLFFGTSALITIVILPVRMIVSIWRRRNRGTY